MKGFWPDGLWLECRVPADAPHIETNHTSFPKDSEWKGASQNKVNKVSKLVILPLKIKSEGGIINSW